MLGFFIPCKSKANCFNYHALGSVAKLAIQVVSSKTNYAYKPLISGDALVNYAVGVVYVNGKKLFETVYFLERKVPDSILSIYPVDEKVIKACVYSFFGTLQQIRNDLDVQREGLEAYDTVSGTIMTQNKIFEAKALGNTYEVQDFSSW